MTDPGAELRFRGGLVGALAPFALFLAGVGWLGLSGAPEERGFWPVLLAALALGLALARDRDAYADAVLDGMSRRIVALMILAWLLAAVLGTLLSASGLVQSLVALARAAGATGGAYAVASFLVACLFSTATGTSLGTLILCAPLLYPPAAAVGAEPTWVLGAVIGGATFGDNVSPVSDTTIASATGQGADMGGVVRSRLWLALPAAALALVGYAALGGAAAGGGTAGPPAADAVALAMLAAPGLALLLLLRRRPLLEGLLAGVAAAVALGLATGRLAPGQVLHIDAEAFGARGLLVEGLERGVGVSIFTLLLMGLVGPLERSGILERLVRLARDSARSRRQAEGWIVATVSGAVLLTTHSVVAILTVSDLAREAGGRHGISAYRRANLLDVTVCTWPFLLPWFIPTILAASTTAVGPEHGLPRLTAFQVGLHNLHSWALLAVLLVSVALGRPRADSDGGEGARAVPGPGDPLGSPGPLGGGNAEPGVS